MIEVSYQNIREESLKKAISGYKRALEVLNKDESRLEYSNVQLSLGIAYGNLADVRDKEVNLGLSIDAYREALKVYTSPHVLVIDEIGYLTYGPDAANVLFHVVNDRHLHHRPIIFTTNKSPFLDWGAVLHDPDLADAIVDRVLERGRLLVLDGPSARTRHIDRTSLEVNETVQEAAIISGIDRPYFPEPTVINDHMISLIALRTE